MIPEWRLQDRLRRALDEADLPVAKMGDYLGVSSTTTSNYLSGRTRPNLATIRAWATVTDVDLDWLLNGDEGPGQDAITPRVTAWKLTNFPVTIAA